MIAWRVPLSDIDYGDEELEAIEEVLKNGWLTMGRVTEQFERAFADYVGARHAIAVSNATAALHMANLVAGIGPGDEVILPSLTFVATANAVKYTGATPVFADISSENDFSISPEAIKAATTANSKAIIVMHYGGHMCDMPKILEHAMEHKLFVIEDAAHAPGARLANRKAGTWGDVGCFSFFSNKNLATGEGGIIVTNRDDLASSMRLLRSHGMTSLTWDRHKGHANSYDVVALGYNYRIDEVRSALGLVQLEKLEPNNQRRRIITDKYQSKLDSMEELSLPYRYHHGVSAAHLFPVVLEHGINRKAFMDSMQEQGIQTSIHYPPVHQFTYYRRDREIPALPVTEEVASREVTLPLYPTMEDEEVDLVAGAVRNALKRSSQFAAPH